MTTVTTPACNVAGDDRLLHFEVERFLVGEARLLDEGKLDEWLDLFTDDARYWMPTFESSPEAELSGGGPEHLQVSIFDDDKSFLVMRVKRLDTGLAHSEQPRSRTRHLISNLALQDIARTDADVDLTALTNFIVFQSRLETSEHFFVGRRQDRLRRRNNVWRIAQRRIWLDHAVLPHAVSTLF